MATYEGNAYELLSQVRYGLNEHSTAYVQETDTSGVFRNAFILNQINAAQYHIYNILLKVIPDEFLASTTLTGVSSVFTLPWDFGSVVQFRDADGYPVYPGTSQGLPITSQLSGASKNCYYRKGQTLVVYQSGVTDTYTLWYRRRPRQIHAGMSSAGGASSLTLSASYAKKIADYYNGMDIENITDDAVDTISDYSAARVATISGTGGASKYYGIVSELPDAFHACIAPLALIFCKKHPLSLEKPSQIEIASWTTLLQEALSAFGREENVSTDDIFYDSALGVGYPFGTVLTDDGYLI